MQWNDTEKIAASLRKLYPDTDPLSVRFTDFREMILKLPGFEDTTHSCNEELLEAIQMAWLKTATEN